MEIYGSDGKSGILQLTQEEPGAVNTLFSRGNSDVFVLYVNKSLGAIQGVQIGHDNFGDSPSWYLEEILIRDVQSKQSGKFMAYQWFALERGNGCIERIIDKTSNHMDFGDEVAKRWISVAAKLRKSRITRVQRANMNSLSKLDR